MKKISFYAHEKEYFLEKDIEFWAYIENFSIYALFGDRILFVFKI